MTFPLCFRKVILIIAVLGFSQASLLYSGVGRWTRTNLFGNCCEAFVFDSVNPQVLFGTAGGQIYKSTNSGKSWVILPLNAGNPAILRIPKADVTRMVVAGSDG